VDVVNLDWSDAVLDRIPTTNGAQPVAINVDMSNIGIPRYELSATAWHRVCWLAHEYHAGYDFPDGVAPVPPRLAFARWLYQRGYING